MKPGRKTGLSLLGSPEPVRGLIGGVAQLGERVLCKHEVVGSIPSASTKLRHLMLSLEAVIKIHG